LRGTEGADELTGTRVKKLVYGLGGADVIATEEGKYRVWGGEDDDTFKTLNGGKGYMKIMDFEAGDTITFCGCALDSKARLEDVGTAQMSLIPFSSLVSTKAVTRPEPTRPR
ncbi:hypothetical protein N9U74_02995, partial [Synechococcus sp. AH-736-M02]|nr:hypothetical protein [Synechococcus sp. AH-736-M02]